MYRVTKEVRSTHGRDGAIVLDVREGQLFQLNLVGSRILELVKNGSGESAIADQISQEFHERRDLVERDTREFLKALKACRLVEELQSSADR